MFGVPKLILIVGILIATILYWASSNVCRYNFAIEKRTNVLNIVTQELDPTLGRAEYYQYVELNCNEIDLDWDIDRVIDNAKTISVIVYQYLNTDIKGDPN
tara:strand:+ start:319 stop:621 length:303 start_codon:yes stop_codon:yes gene_type:complete